MSNKLIDTPEFERRPQHEIEKKLLPILPELLAGLREQARPIEQYYLSHPLEDFSLRMRETIEKPGELSYFATLKDRGVITEYGIDRLEVEVPISRDTYEFYKPGMPLLRKLRAQVNNGVVVDFYDNGHIQVESENQIAWTNFCDRYGSAFVDVTGDRIVDNEWRAHMNYRRENKGHEALLPAPELDYDEIVDDIYERFMTHGSAAVKICGRSGSGKSALVGQVKHLRHCKRRHID